MKELIKIEDFNGNTTYCITIEYIGEHYLLCYAQNKLFTIYIPNDGSLHYDRIIIEHCIIPKYDDILKDYIKE